MLSIEYSDDLVLDLSWYEGDFAKRYTRTYELDEFKIKAKIATSEQIAKATEGVTANRRTWLGREIWELKKEEQFTGFKHEYLTKRARHIVLEGYWQSERYFSSISDKLYQEIRLREGMNELGDRIIEEMQTKISISIHIRRGDYLGKARKLHGVLSTLYYLRAVDYIQSRFPGAHYFVFSDDPEWCKEHLEFLNSKKIISDQTRYEAWTPAQELILMSACSHNIIANSSFSWWGGWLNRNKAKIVIAPKRWFSGREEASDVLPIEWVRMDNDFEA
jgi:hypothetical protein